MGWEVELGLRAGTLRASLWAVALAGALSLAAPTDALAFKLFGITLFGEDEADTAGIADPVFYTTTIVLTEPDSKLSAKIEEASLLVSQQDLPPAGLVGLLQRAKDDQANLVGRLYEEALYGAVVAITIEGRPIDKISVTEEWTGGTREAPVTIEVSPGPEFTFGGITLSGANGGAEAAAAEAGLVPGRRAESTTIVAAEAAILESLQRQGHAYAAIADRQIVADHASDTLDVAIIAERGPVVTLGPTIVEGADRLDPDFLAGQADIPEGVQFDPDILERARARLAKLEALASVTVRIADHPDANGVAPVIIEVSERKRRTIGAGLFYSSAEGAGTELFWVHRNLFGHAETLRLEAELGRILRATHIDDYDARFSLLYGVPGILGPDTRFDFKATALQEDPEPYNRRGVVFEALLTRDLTDHLSLTGGITYDWSRIDDSFGRNNYSLITFPASLQYDTRNDILDPTKGMFARLLAETEYETSDGALYLRTDSELRTYFALDEDERFVIAARAMAGSIWGAELRDIPAHRRFYAGGGGSVRGYEYLNIGPRAPGFGPTGGLTRVEGSLEARIKVTDTIGIVPFADAGFVTADSGFGGRDDFQASVGLGLRYYTSVGPIRLDVAFPLDRRDGDPDFAVYAGIGQAF
jgi:translocation and assembly module TamA